MDGIFFQDQKDDEWNFSFLRIKSVENISEILEVETLIRYI